jgi:hypothetical protein
MRQTRMDSWEVFEDEAPEGSRLVCVVYGENAEERARQIAALPGLADALRPFASWAQTSTWHQAMATVHADDCRKALEVLRRAGLIPEGGRL